ncbi:GNAT family N-acetyltransferase [Arenimonas sp. MALMAid1274]|uniref:GNAT family N-acetyltransferase n=1 Tax=Arenimonas sp. MALMAid1274 TaxID=3411630 RepID=UPI003B9EFBB1
MDFEIREMPRTEAEVLQVFDVCRSAFPNIHLDRFRSNWLSSSDLSTFFGAYSEGRLVAVNGFIAHRILLDGCRRQAFQSCWSATAPDFRGKGLFTKIINHAKGALAGRAAFIFGFPNHLSGPIFTGKLGFQEVAMARAVFATRGPRAMLQQQLACGRYQDALSSSSLVKFDQYENAAWKRQEYGPALIEFEHNTNYMWGTVATRNVGGAEVKVLLVGGCEINKPRLFGELMRAVGRKGGISLARIVCSRKSLLATSARFVLSGSRTEPFIHFPVDVATDRLQFDAYTGLKDVY